MTSSKLSADERLDILDTFLQVGLAIDTADAVLMASVFTEDATFDFGPAARFAGIDFPIMVGRDAVASGLIGSVGQLDTIHQVTNARYEVTPEGVTLSTIVEAAHFPPTDHNRHLTQKNRHITNLVKVNGEWLITSNVVNGATVDGDITVITG
jgi:hypothetical protein